MSAPEPAVLQALQGHPQDSGKWPGPRAVKFYVASVYNGQIVLQFLPLNLFTQLGNTLKSAPTVLSSCLLSCNKRQRKFHNLLQKSSLNCIEI